MLTHKTIFLTVSAIFLNRAGGVCFCPMTCLNCRDNGELVNTAVHKPAACNDMESAQECEKANWEIKDMQNSLVPLVMLFLE